jgi:PPOX class probable F420-dependent enzyme
VTDTRLRDEDRALLKGKNFAHVATLRADGSPAVTPVWVDVDEDGNVLLNSAVGRLKDRNIRRDPRLALSVQDQEDPYRWLSVEGEATIEEGERAETHIQELAQLYWGHAYDRESGPRVIYRVRPTRVLRSAD